ncbi:ABC transporter permease [Spirillospora sp. NBC_01491]|uniref:ABC transporter permease n=1 Tax=Spirillospora sp. NBC_01491 TaxID=2976007 RepID=UPI002E3445ED|nr:ABC transporter permease [Spirillospora sp. NBC_01491]
MNRLEGEVRAVVATTRKELRLMRRYPAEIVSLALWMLLLPLAYIAQATALSSDAPASVDAFAERAGTGDFVAFLYLGWSVYLWLTAVLWGPGLALRQERARGSFEIVFASPVSRFTLLFGGAPAQLVPALVVFASAAVSMRLLFGVPLGWGDLACWLAVLLVAFPALMALGAVFATASLSLQDAAGALQITRGVFTLLCGVTYPLAVLPGALRAVGESLPPTHLLDALRAVTVGSGSLTGELPRLLLLLAEAVPIGAVAMALLWLSVRYARKTGRLGLF